MEFSSSPAFEGRKIFYLDAVKIFFEIIREKIRRIKSFPRNIFLKQLPLPPPNSLLIFSFKDTQRERERKAFAIKEAGKSLERGLRKDNVCGYGTTRFSFAALRVGQIFWEQRRGVRGRRERERERDSLVDFAGEARGGHGVAQVAPDRNNRVWYRVGASGLRITNKRDYDALCASLHGSGIVYRGSIDPWSKFRHLPSSRHSRIFPLPSLRSNFPFQFWFLNFYFWRSLSIIDYYTARRQSWSFPKLFYSTFFLLFIWKKFTHFRLDWRFA